MNISLRPISHRHQGFLIDLLNQPSVAKFNDFDLPVLAEDVFEFIQFDIEALLMKTGIRFVIYLDDVAIGTCGGQFKTDYFQLGFELSEAFQGQGIMAQVLPLLINDVAARYQCQTYQALVDARNVASIKLLERANFQLNKESEGIKHYYFVLGDNR